MVFLMAIVKASYTKKKQAAKASIRYIEHRPGKDNAKTSRTLFGSDGAMERVHAYELIDQASKGSSFFRFVISPDPAQEDSEKDLHLWDVTQKTMHALQDRLHKPLVWVAAEHTDHTPHRHIHIVAVVHGRLQREDFQMLRHAATEACLEQRSERDLLREHHARSEREGAQRER
jgi:hypothetical protein